MGVAKDEAAGLLRERVHVNEVDLVIDVVSRLIDELDIATDTGLDELVTTAVEDPGEVELKTVEEETATKDELDGVITTVDDDTAVLD